MVLNAPLGWTESMLRSLAAKTVYTLHFVAVWAGFVALRDAYVLSPGRKPGVVTDLAGSFLYYLTASIMGVSDRDHVRVYLSACMWVRLARAACMHRLLEMQRGQMLGSSR